MASSKKLFHSDMLYILPIGGCGQFGGNMTFYGMNGDWVVVDCGAAFADERMPGVDLMMPNPSGIPAQCRKGIKALVITHAHEDHVGGVVTLWPELGYPDIYASPFAHEVLLRKFSEAQYKQRPTIITFEPEEVLPFGDMEFIPVSVSHSIPEAHGLFIRTPIGTVLHSGDWNIDPSPVLGEKTRKEVFERYAGEDGILAYVGDSTNAESDGISPSERDAAEGLEGAFKECKGKIAITIFSSNISRIHSICKAAQKVGRHVALAGRSLEAMAQNAQSCGYLEDIPPFVDVRDMASLPKNKQVYIITGSQGEGRASLAKIAQGAHKHISLKKGDHVMFSARKIPGNERAISDLMNLLISAGVEVITPKDHMIHVSGHPYKGEIETMLEWVRPKIMIPVHGEKTQMMAQGKIATMPDGSNRVIEVCVPDNGALMQVSPDGAEIVARYDCPMRPVVFGDVVDPDYAPLRDRKKVSFHGCVFVSLFVNSETTEMEELNLSVVGLLDLDRPEHQKLYDKCAQSMEEGFYRLSQRDRINPEKVEKEITNQARRFFRNVFDVKPLVELHISIG